MIKYAVFGLPYMLFWVYLINAVLLINHEIDSAYWREWRLFNLPGGITGFLLIHFPLLFLVLYGLFLVGTGDPLGDIFSLGLSMTGIGAFAIHGFFILKGREEFNTPMSLFILGATLIVSMIQLILTIMK